MNLYLPLSVSPIHNNNIYSYLACPKCYSKVKFLKSEPLTEDEIFEEINSNLQNLKIYVGKENFHLNYQKELDEKINFKTHQKSYFGCKKCGSSWKGKDLIYRLYLTLNILISKINHVKKKTIFGKELEQKIFKNIGQESTSERQIDEEKCKYLTSATKTSNNLNFNIQNLLLGKFNFFNYGLNDNETCSRSVFSLFKTNSNFNEEVEFLLEFEESYVYLPSN